MASPLFFVPVALAGSKVFFKFATKKAAQAFKGKYAKAGSVTTKTPAKNAQVVTTGSSKGQAIIKDMTKPTTQPSIRLRNPNTKTLPKAPKKGSGAVAATATAATGAGVAGSAKSTGDAEKPNKRKAPDRSADTVSRQQSQFAKRGSIDAKKPKTALEVNILLGGGMKKDTKKTDASPTSKPKNVPKRKAKDSNVKLSSGKTVKQRLAEIDKEKAASKRMELRKKLRDQMKKIAQDKKNKEFVKKAFSKGKK